MLSVFISFLFCRAPPRGRLSYAAAPPPCRAVISGDLEDFSVPGPAPKLILGARGGGLYFERARSLASSRTQFGATRGPAAKVVSYCCGTGVSGPSRGHWWGLLGSVGRTGVRWPPGSPELALHPPFEVVDRGQPSAKARRESGSRRFDFPEAMTAGLRSLRFVGRSSWTLLSNSVWPLHVVRHRGGVTSPPPEPNGGCRCNSDVAPPPVLASPRSSERLSCLPQQLPARCPPAAIGPLRKFPPTLGGID